MQLLQLPFQAYAKLFLRVTLAVSRAQEYAADRLAAKVEGAKPLMESLRRIHGAALAYGPYLEQELSPVIGAGYRPPIAAGFAAFAGAESIAAAIGTAIEQEIAEGEASPWDSHPCLRDRLAALDSLDEGHEADPDERPAITLLSDLAATEAAMLQAMLASPQPMADVTWEDVGTTVMLPRLRETAEKVADQLRGRSLGEVPLDEPALAALGRAWLGDEVPQEHLVDAGAHALQAAGVVRLADAGLPVTSTPGEPVKAGGFAPAQWIAKVRAEEADREAWAEALRQAGADPELVW